MNQGDASVLIPAYGPAHLTDACLIAVAATAEMGQIIVWNNGVDHDEDAPETHLLDQVLARSEQGRTMMKGVWNLGFAGACNKMAEAATGEILVFLNCDTEPQPGWLEAIVSAFDNPDVGVVGVRLVKEDGSLHHSGVKVTLGGLAWASEIEEDLPTRDVAAVSGACIAVRREAFDKVGGFDSAFWNCFEDIDLCLRVVKAGYRVRYVRESLVMHHYKATGPERWTAVYPQVKRFQEKWAGERILAPS